jgi:hypothetical protein
MAASKKIKKTDGTQTVFGANHKVVGNIAAPKKAATGALTSALGGPRLVKGIDSVRYFHGSVLHRTDGPAIEYANGDYEYYVNGLLHREDGPAHNVDGTESWYVKGALHRNGGPAYKSDIEEAWFMNGDLHRSDGGPAVKQSHTGFESYWVDGQLHRTDGPARIESDGTTSFWLEGRPMSEDAYWDAVGLKDDFDKYS